MVVFISGVVKYPEHTLRETGDFADIIKVRVRHLRMPLLISRGDTPCVDVIQWETRVYLGRHYHHLAVL